MELVSFSIDKLELIEATNKSQFARAKVDCFASGNNAHNMPMSEDTLRKYAETILGKPLTYVIEKPWFGKVDFGDHDALQVPMGYFSELNAEIEFRELGDGRIMMSAYANIWKRYASSALKIFARDGMKKSVSVEMQVINTEEDELGRKEIKDFAFAGCTVLGSKVNPAVKDANIEILEFSQAKEQNEKLLKQYKEIDFSFPSQIRDNIKLAIEKANEEGISILPTTLAKANYIIKNKAVSPEKIDSFISFFNKHKDDISFSLCGGEESKTWFKSISEKMSEIDQVVFSKTETKEDEKMEDIKLSEEEVDKKEEDFATDSNVEPAAQIARSEEETEGDKEAVEEEKEEKESFSEEEEKSEEEAEKEEEDKEAHMACEEKAQEEKMCDLQANYSELEKQFSTLKEEVEELRKFKQNVLNQERATKIEFAISEVAEVIPRERLDELKVFAETEQNIDVWVNALKAEAYTYMQKQIRNSNGVLKMALPDSGSKKTDAKKSLWAD